MRLCSNLQVYIPVNNGGAHWLAACVDLKARHIDLYDPNMGNKYVQNRELKNAECLTYMLPYLLRDGGYYEKNPDVPPTLDPFTMTMIKDAPRQDNGYECVVISNNFYCCCFIVVTCENTRGWFSLMLIINAILQG